MSTPTNPADLVDRSADERLLGEQMEVLPEAEQTDRPAPPGQARRWLLTAGTTLTTVTLLGGIALIVVAMVAAIGGSFGGADAVAAVAGVLLVATHWGWVHTAEAIAVAIEHRHGRRRGDQHRDWLEAIKPYTRWSVTTAALEDGSIRIVRTRHTPVPTSAGRFSFTRQVETEELHEGDAPAAEIAERAEALRHAAAADSERERRRWEVAHDAYERVLLDGDDEQQRLAARRAAAHALSEQINTNLREPPLIE